MGDRRAMSNSSIVPRLIALTDTERFSQSILQLERLCKDARPRSVAIVLRDRQLSARERFGVGVTLRALTQTFDQMLLVADRLDLCLALNADGMHLGSEAVLPSQVRSHVAWLSSSVHRVEQMGATELALLDAVLVSPTFAALKGRAALERTGIERWVAKIRASNILPAPQLYALGGINHRNAPVAIDAGCAGVAGISTFMDPVRRDALLNVLGLVREI